MDAVKEDMQVVGVRIEDTENRVKLKTLIRCGNLWKGKSCKKKKDVYERFVQEMRLFPFLEKALFRHCFMDNVMSVKASPVGFERYTTFVFS